MNNDRDNDLNNVHDTVLSGENHGLDNDMNGVQDNNTEISEREKAKKLSDAIGELSEKTVSETDLRRKLLSGTAEKTAAGNIWRAKKIWIPAVSAAACAVIAVVLGSGVLWNNLPTDDNVHDFSSSEQNFSVTSTFDTEPTVSETDTETEKDTDTNADFPNYGADKNFFPSADFIPDISKPGEYDLSEYVEVLGRSEYPDMAFFPSYDWIAEREERIAIDEKIDHEALLNFNKSTSLEFLGSSNGENRVYSPANIYITLSILTELTDGESRQQILSLTGFDSIEALREQSAALWKNLYCLDGSCTSVLANSLWLNSGTEVNADTVNKVAEEYFASVFRGDMSDGNTVTAMKKWLDDQTDGLLEDSVNNFSLTPDTLMTLCSAVYFNAKWRDEFDEEENDFRIFHGNDGDKEIEFMNITKPAEYYWGRDYSASYLSLDNFGAMWFILPDEDKSIDDVLKSGEYLEMINSEKNIEGWENKSDNDISFSVPKFDVSSDIELSDGLVALGVRDIFNGGEADFSPFLQGNEGFYINKTEHAARVVIDEKGCIAAAYTTMVGGMGGPPDYEDVDFVLDRPFVFVITGNGGNVLFIGTVCD